MMGGMDPTRAALKKLLSLLGEGEMPKDDPMAEGPEIEIEGMIPGKEGMAEDAMSEEEPVSDDEASIQEEMKRLFKGGDSSGGGKKGLRVGMTSVSAAPIKKGY